MKNNIKINKPNFVLEKDELSGRIKDGIEFKFSMVKIDRVNYTGVYGIDKLLTRTI